MLNGVDADATATVPANGQMVTSTVTILNQDLDGLGGPSDDSFSFDLNIARGGTGTDAIVFQNFGIAPGFNFRAGEELIFTVSNITVLSGSAASAGDLTFDGFSGGSVNLQRGGATTDSTADIDLNGNTISSVLPADPGFTSIITGVDFAVSPTLTFDNVVTTGGGGFAARALDLEFTYTPVPEPSSALLLGLGAFGLLRRRRN